MSKKKAQRCWFSGCNRAAKEVYQDDVVVGWFCDRHAKEEGYCIGCGNLADYINDSGLCPGCESCWQEALEENQELADSEFLN